MKWIVIFAILIAVAYGIPRTAPDFSNRIQQNLRTKFRGRIVGGTPADISSFPHMLALYDLSSTGFICGASIIADRWALSAAHCLYFRVDPSLINLRGGSTYHASGGIIFYTESYTLHPQYKHSLKEFDIAIIHTMESSLMRGTNIQAIPLPGICQTDCCLTCPPDQVTTTGWGKNAVGSFPQNLFQITLPIVDRQSCSATWNGIGQMFFCVQNLVGKDSCSGDSGSPIVKKIGTQMMQIGIVSFGTTVCGDGTKPSVATRVELPEIRNWITSMSGI
ncbi:hypothetical protein ACKWTF_014852 [Chironomus riparius]